MDKKQLQQILVAIPIFLALGGYGFYKYLLTPLNAKEATVKKDLNKLLKDYKQSVSRSKRLPQLEYEISVLEQEVDDLNRKLPPTKDVSSLIQFLSNRMSFYNIIWTRIAPKPVATRSNYVEHSYTIPFQCSYHSLAKFLAEVGQMERIFSTQLSSLNSLTDPRTGQQVITGTLTFLIFTAP